MYDYRIQLQHTNTDNWVESGDEVGHADTLAKFL